MPSLVARDAFLLALAIPLVRKIVSALARSLPASSKARLQSIIPAFVFSRSCLTSFGSISAITFIEFEFDGRRSRSLGGNAGHFDLFANAGFAARRNDRINQLLQNDSNRANRVVISRNRVIDQFGVGVRFDNRNYGNVEASRFVDRILLAGRVDYDQSIGQLRHFENSIEVATELGRFPIQCCEFLLTHFLYSADCSICSMYLSRPMLFRMVARLVNVPPSQR